MVLRAFRRAALMRHAAWRKRLTTRLDGTLARANLRWLRFLRKLARRLECGFGEAGAFHGSALHLLKILHAVAATRGTWPFRMASVRSTVRASPSPFPRTPVNTS